MSAQPAGGVPRLPTAVGAIVMAGGVFGAAALQRIPAAGVDATRLLAVVLAFVWAVSAGLIMVSALKEGVAAHTNPVLGSFAIGTWVAGTAVMARMLMLAAPTALWLAKGALIASVGLWAWFFPRALRNLARVLISREIRPGGLILLPTVASQAVALLALRLYPAVPPVRWSAGALVALGVLCYIVGLFAIIRRYAAHEDWHLAADWHNSNCILHGALSISGLAAITGGFVDIGTVSSSGHARSWHSSWWNPWKRRGSSPGCASSAGTMGCWSMIPRNGRGTSRSECSTLSRLPLPTALT